MHIKTDKQKLKTIKSGLPRQKGKEKMSEAYQNPQQPEVYTPTAEELRDGFVLNPDETVAFDVNPDPTGANRSFRGPGGIDITGRAVAEIRLGGEQTFAKGLVINTFEAPNRKDFALLISSPNSPEPTVMKLAQGQLWGMGRQFEGQDRLPDTVSRDHCAVGLDEQNQLVIENHNPTNMTAVRRLGKF